MKFKFFIADFDKLSNLIDSVMKIMSIENISSDIIFHAFTKNVLNIEICELNCLQLILIDFSDFIYSENQSQNHNDVILIFELMK